MQLGSFTDADDEDEDDAEDEDENDAEFHEDTLRRDDRRTKVIALSGLAVVAVIAIAVIVLVSMIDTSSTSVPRSPQAAAEQWGNAVVHNNTTRRHQLECAVGTESGDLLRLVVASASGVHAGAVTHLAANRWRVTLNIDGIGAGAKFPVVVIRSGGAYQVC